MAHSYLTKRINDHGGKNMSVNLQKGQKVDLTKGNTGLKTILVGLGWDEAPRKFSLF